MFTITRPQIILIIILNFSLFLRLIIAFGFPNILWPDEIFQSLEQAHRLAFGYGIIPWEFRDGIRSWFFPGILGLIMKLIGWLNIKGLNYLDGVIIFLCLLSLIPVWIGFSIAYKTRGLTAAIIASVICSIWFEFIYFSPKALTEVIASYTLLIAVYFGVYNKPFLNNYSMINIGFWYGLTTVLRLHFLPAVAIGIIYQYRTNKNLKFIFLIIGFSIPLIFSGILDTFTWSYPFQSLWKNVWMNLVEGKSTEFGVSPWHQYFDWLLLNWSLFLLPILFFCGLVLRRHFVLISMALVLIISHSFIAHKEYRFMYGALQIIIIVAALGTAELVVNLQFSKRFSKGLAIGAIISLISWGVASGILATRFDTDRSLEIKNIFQGSEVTHWTKHRETLLAFQDVSKQNDVCGVGVAGINWAFSGGYTYLHHGVPLHFIENNEILDQKQTFEALSQNFNYFMVHSLEFIPQGFELDKCYGKMCIYKRPAVCKLELGKELFQIISTGF